MGALVNGRIEGSMVYLRPITREDTDHIVQWRNSEIVRPYFIYQEPFTREGHLKWLETMIDTKKGYQFIACDKKTNQPVGCTYLRDFDKKHNKIEIGIFLGEKEWMGRGLGSEMINLTVQFGFEELHIHKVFSRIFADNIASMKSFEKCGFIREAYFKEEVFVNTQYRDIIFMAVINPAKVYPQQEETA